MKKFYSIHPPYIDAYLRSYDEGQYITFNGFKQKLISHAISWGEQSIGAQFLREKPKLIDNMPVWCCGVWGNKKYVLVGAYGWYFNGRQDAKIIEYDYDDDWNVT